LNGIMYVYIFVRICIYTYICMYMYIYVCNIGQNSIYFVFIGQNSCLDAVGRRHMCIHLHKHSCIYEYIGLYSKCTYVILAKKNV